MSSRTASCSCGQLRIQVEGEPRGVGICHCLACQQRTGSVFAALASFSAPFKVFGNATEYVRVGDQGAKFIFRFCPVCGTTVFHTEDGHDESVGVAVGAFADPNFPPPRVSIYDNRRNPSVSCRQDRERTTKIPLDYKLCLCRTDSEVTPNRSSCSAPFAMMSGRTRTERHEDFQSSCRETICHHRSLLVSIQAFNGSLSQSILPIRTHSGI
jgi:hypothetical protein